jgi:predicted dehydrogenase
MADACADAGVQLTINHQQRLGPVFRQAKTLLDDGAIGDLRRIEWSQKNLFDSGTHLFALATYYTDAEPVEWVLAGLDYREENRWFGTHNENQAIAQWRYENGVSGLAVTGEGSDAVDPYLALVGTDGRIELGASDAPPLRYFSSDTTGWKTVDAGENIWGDHYPSTVRAGLSLLARNVPVVDDDLFEVDYPGHIDRAIAEVVEAHRTGRDSELRVDLALQSTELIFAAYESVRRRGRVDLPLEVDDNPLESMVEDGLVAVTAE